MFTEHFVSSIENVRLVFFICVVFFCYGAPIFDYTLFVEHLIRFHYTLTRYVHYRLLTQPKNALTQQTPPNAYNSWHKTFFCFYCILHDTFTLGVSTTAYKSIYLSIYSLSFSRCDFQRINTNDKIPLIYFYSIEVQAIFVLMDMPLSSIKAHKIVVLCNGIVEKHASAAGKQEKTSIAFWATNNFQ